MGATEMPARTLQSGLLLIVASSLFAGCLAGANYSRPIMPTPPDYRFIQPPSQAQTLADAPWFQVFDDPALQGLIREAITNNLDLRIAVARVEEARARAGIAKSYLYPQINGVAGYGVRQATTTDQNDDTTHQNAAYGFNLSWEIDLFGRIRRGTEAAVALALASEQGRRGVMVTLVGDVATNYFLLRELDLQLEIANETLRLNDETVTYFTNRLQGGVANRLELDRIQANRSQTAAAIPEIERQIAVAENGLSMLLGRSPGPITRDRLTIAETLPPAIPPGIPASILERRPDVLQAEQFLVAANADIGVAKALFYPNISLTGFLGGISGDLTTFLGGSGAVWSAGAQLLQPVFQAGRLRRNLEAMQAQFDAALAGYQKTALNSYREVADALVTIQKLAEQRGHRELGVAGLQDASDSVARAVRLRARELHRDPHRRPAALRTAAPPGADARRRVACARGTVPRARRRLATVV